MISCLLLKNHKRYQTDSWHGWGKCGSRHLVPLQPYEKETLDNS